MRTLQRLNKIWSLKQKIYVGAFLCININETKLFNFIQIKVNLIH